MRLSRVDFHHPVHFSGNMLTSASAPSADIDFDEKTKLVTVKARDRRVIVPLSNIRAMHPSESLRDAAQK